MTEMITFEGLLRHSGGLDEQWTVSRCWWWEAVLEAYVKARGSRLWAPLALREDHSVSGPVVHQLVQVVCEGALGLLGRWGEVGSGRRVMGVTGLLVVVRSTVRTGPTRS